MKPMLLAPIHPGEHLYEDFMKPLNLSINQLAKAIGVSESRVRNIIQKKTGISMDTALRLALFFNMSAQFWLNLQLRYDLECAQDRIGDQLTQEVVPLTR